MGDANVSVGDDPMNIDTLRKLALLSMPKRQGRNLMLSNPSLKSEGPTVFPSPAAKPSEDKEEGELSSDDDAEGATATFAPVEPASDQDQAALKSRLSSQGSPKEMLAPGATFTGSNSNEGLSTASVAEAFLASLRIPVPKSSRATGDDKKEDDFVIKFDEDSDSDAEHRPSLSSSSTQLGSNAEKITTGSVSLPSTTPVPQAVSAGPNQKPSGLKSEIDRMKKQIAAMERSKGKPSALPVVGKSIRVVSADTTRPSVSPATEPKSVAQVSTGNIRSVPDLESLRLQIAAKENELQQRRQRLAARGPEASKVASDVKGTGAVVSTTALPLSSRTSTEGNYLGGLSANPPGGVSAEKTLVTIRKEALNQAEGLIALASIGPSGVCPPSYKKDFRLNGGDSCVDHQNVDEDVSKLSSFRAGTYLNTSTGRHLVSKGTKRSHAAVECLENMKVARTDGGPALIDNIVSANPSKEPALSEALPVTVNGTCKTLPVQASCQTKRKVDDIGMPYEGVVVLPGPSNSMGSNASKKTKLTANAVPGDVSRVGSFSNPKPSGPFQTLQGTRPMSSTGLGQTEYSNEKVFAAMTVGSTQADGSTTTEIALRSVAKEGEDVMRGQKAGMVNEEPSASERFCGANTAAHFQSTEAPTLVKGLAKLVANEDEHVLQIQKLRLQYEGSHALPALAGVSVPDAGVVEPVAITESSVKKHDFVSSNQQVREGFKVKTDMYLRPSSVLLPPEAHLEHPAQQSLGFGHSYADNWDVDPDAETFAQLQAEEELLDKELEEAQEERHRCELRERLARKEYREAQRALHEVNAQCDRLSQRKEFLLSRIHLVEGRKYSRRLPTSRNPWLISSVDNPSLRLTGLEVAPPCSPKKPSTSLEHCAVSLPLHQPSREPGSCGADGGQMLAMRVAKSQGPPAVKPAGVTTLVEILRRDSLTEADEDVGSIWKGATADGLQNPVLHGHGGAVGLRKVLDGDFADERSIYASAPQTEWVDLPSVGAHEAAVISSSTPTRESLETAVTIWDARAHDHCLPEGQKVVFSAGSFKSARFDGRSERTVTEGQQAQAKRDACSPLAVEQDKETAAVACGTPVVARCTISSPVVAHEHVQTSGVAVDTGPGMKGDQAVPGLSSSTVDTFLEIASLSQDPDMVCRTTEIISSFVGVADEGKTSGSDANMTTSKEDKPVPQKMGQVSVEKNTVVKVPKSIKDGSSSERKMIDVTTRVSLVPPAFSADMGIPRDVQVQRVHNFPTPRVLESPASEALDVESPADLGLKGLSRSIADLAVSSSIKDNAFGAPDLPGRAADEGPQQVEGLKSMTEEKRDGAPRNGGLIAVYADGPVDYSPERGSFAKLESDNCEDLPADYPGFSSEVISLNGVELSCFATGINHSGEVRETRRQLLEHEERLILEVLSYENKTSPTVSNSRRSQHILSETGRGARGGSEDLSTWTDHVEIREQKKTMRSNNSAVEEAMCQTTGFAGGFGDMNTVEPYEEQGTHSSDKVDMSRKVKRLENLKSVSGPEDRSFSSTPGSAPDLQRRQETLDGGIRSMERHDLSAVETTPETKEQYSVTCQSNHDDVVGRNDRCSSELEVTKDLPDQRPAEDCCTPGPDPEQEQHVMVPLSSDPGGQTVAKCFPWEEGVVRGDAVSKAFCHSMNGDEDHQKQAVALQTLEDGHSRAFDQNRGREYESGRRASADGEAVNYRHEWPNSSACELKESNSGKEIENSRGVEVEVFRKALLEGNALKGSSGGEEAVAMMGAQTQRRESNKEQILPELQHHRLDQLLDMVEVGTQGAVVHGEGQSLKGPLIAGCVVEAESAHKATERTKLAKVPGEQKAEVRPKASNRGFPAVSSGGEHWVPSAVGFVSLMCIRGIVASPSDTPILDKSSNVKDQEYVPAGGGPTVRPRYESPLTVFRAYRSLPQFASAMQLSISSNTWSHAIDPHKPLCRFEHRGQCRNEHCPWQHADDYTLSPQISSEIQSREPRKAVILNEKMDDRPSSRPSAGSFVGSSQPPQKSGVGSSGKLQTSGSLLSSNGLSLQGSPLTKPHDFDISVPTYRIGYYTLKAEDPTSTRLGILGIQRKVKTEIYRSFLLSPSIHRTLPPDSPCLVDSSKSKLSTIGASSQVPHWRYTGKLQEERIFSESVSPHASKDVEMWLEVALKHIDFDITSDKSKARDEALCILSRGLETKQNSVTLWMAYSCLFHTRRDNPESDDMFQFAIQYNPGSYELWLLYINSRPDLPSRLEAYERAIVALVEKGKQMEQFSEDSSACVLDITLQMLYCMCVSGCLEDAFLWVEDLIHDASAAEEEKCHRGSTLAVLSHLTPQDSCILWISCAYLSACGGMPLVITRRLGYRQDLPYNLHWDTSASSERVACLRVMKTLSTAISAARGCLSLEEPHPPASDKNNHSKEVLGVNYVQCLAFYEGLESAARVSQQLIGLYPTSVELILLHAHVVERRAGTDAGLQVFDEAVSRWPVDQPGIQRLWNQYAAHGLAWGGNYLAHKVLSKSVPSKTQPASEHFEDSLSMPLVSQGNAPTHNADVNTVTRPEKASPGRWSEIREHFLFLTTRVSRRSEESPSVQSYKADDSVYALINLALTEALSGDRVASQSAINKATKIAVSDRDSRQCWKELASLQFSGVDVDGHTILRLLDRCKTESYILSQLKPLSLRVLEDLRRPQVRKFFVDLLGLLPVDHSLLNSILELCYGPSLLPLESLTRKDVLHFAEGILEAVPGNVEVALSLCKVVFQGGSGWAKSLSSAVWASALLISSLEQSCPAAPEVYWVEAGLLLKELRKGKSLEEYYLHALVRYPFSAALRHGLGEARLLIQESDSTGGGVQRADMIRDVEGLIEG